MKLSRLKAKLKDSKRKKSSNYAKIYTKENHCQRRKKPKSRQKAKRKKPKSRQRQKRKKPKSRQRQKRKKPKSRQRQKRKPKSRQRQKERSQKAGRGKKERSQKAGRREEQAKKKAEEEAKRTYEEELEEQLTEEEITDFQIHKTDMDRLINHVCEIVATYGNNGIHQSDLWKKLKLTSRDGSRLALKLERMGLITREKILLKGRWTYKLIIVKSPIGTESLEGAPCLVCPVESKCSLDGEISPKTCQFIEDWVLIELKTKKSK